MRAAHDSRQSDGQEIAVVSPKRSASAALAVLIFALTLSGVMAWHGSDQRVPQDDCAKLACTSLEIYQAWEQQGVVAGLKALYSNNGWRPIVLPNLAAPLVFPFRGKVGQHD